MCNSFRRRISYICTSDPYVLNYFLFTKDNAYLTAGTSSSSPKIGGSGPSGVMLNGLIYKVLAHLPSLKKKETNLCMTLRIVAFDVCEFRRTAESLAVPVQIPQPLMDMWESASDIPYIRLEMLHIDGIKSHNRREQSNICFRNLVSKIIWSWGGGEMGFDALERSKE